MSDEVNGPWMCDLGRLAYRGVHNEKRLMQPGLRREGGVVHRRDQLEAGEIAGWAQYFFY